jgi:hypothetical protein
MALAEGLQLFSDQSSTKGVLPRYAVRSHIKSSLIIEFWGTIAVCAVVLERNAI